MNSLSIICFGTNLCPKTKLPPRNHSLSFLGEFRKALSDRVNLLHTVPSFRLYFAYRICIYCTTFLHPGSFSGKSGRTWSKLKGRSIHFGSENSYVIRKVWQWFWSFWINFYSLQPFSYSSWQFIYLSQRWTYLLST